MIDGSEQRILDAALKEFGKKGYEGAKIKIIAQKSGLSEMTLFRKFKTKENLFDRVLIRNKEQTFKDFNSITTDHGDENPQDFLRTLIQNIAKLVEDNSEFINLMINERSRISEPLIEDFVRRLGEYIERHIRNSEIDYKALAVTIFSFLHVLVLSKHYGDTFINHDEILEGFINNSIPCIQPSSN